MTVTRDKWIKALDRVAPTYCSDDGAAGKDHATWTAPLGGLTVTIRLEPEDTMCRALVPRVSVGQIGIQPSDALDTLAQLQDAQRTLEKAIQAWAHVRHLRVAVDSGRP